MEVSPRLLATYGRWLGASIALGTLFAVAACPSRARLQGQAMDQLEEQYTRDRLYLKQSLYVGPFYDDTARSLVDPHPFGELKLMTTPDGDIIVPPPPQGIVPAGTQVEVMAIEFPTSAAIVKRPLFTPRYNVWVLLKVARAGGAEPLFRAGQYVLVVPTSLGNDVDKLRGYLELLLTHDDVAAWMAQRSDAARLAIEEKRAQEGLSWEELLAAVGLPDRMEQAFDGEKKVERARYGATEVVLVDGVVRELATAPASQPQ